MARHRAFMQRMREGDSYGVLLLLIFATYGIMAVVESSEWGRVLLAGAFASVLLLTLHTSHVRGRWMRIAIVLVGLTVAASVVQAVVGDAFRGGHVIVVLVVLAPFVILNRILRHPVVNLETILGAVCAYLLIGLAFASLYAELEQLGTEYFFAQGKVTDPVYFLYFSYVVLTTLGFGDLTPATDEGRILVTMEALIGQIFLVTLVASLVGSFGRSRTSGDETKS